MGCAKLASFVVFVGVFERRRGLMHHSFDRAFALYTAALSVFLLEDDIPFNPAICGTSGTGKNFLTGRSRDEASKHFLCGSAPPDVRRLTRFYKGVPEVRYSDAG
mgnify:FL=1